jgi:hypothetical protein
MIIHLVTVRPLLVSNDGDADMEAKMFFTFLAVCTMGAVAGFQSKWFAICTSPSQLLLNSRLQ